MIHAAGQEIVVVWDGCKRYNLHMVFDLWYIHFPRGFRERIACPRWALYVFDKFSVVPSKSRTFFGVSKMRCTYEDRRGSKEFCIFTNPSGTGKTLATRANLIFLTKINFFTVFVKILFMRFYARQVNDKKYKR